MPSSSPWLDDLIGSPGWFMMQECLKEQKVPAATWQNLLAVHTSTCCAPGKATRLVPSLEEAGLRTPVTDPGTGKMHVTLVIEELFPEMKFGAHSSWHDDHASAKEEVCFDILTFALLLAPHMVRIHPNSVKDGEVSIAKVRSLGECMVMTNEVLEAWQKRLLAFPRAPQLMPVPRNQPSPTSGGAGSGGAAASSPPISAKNRAENEAQAEALILAHYAGGAWHNPSCLNQAVFRGLERLLPKGKLRSFLRARVHIFEIRETGVGRNWEFRCIQ